MLIRTIISFIIILLLVSGVFAIDDLDFQNTNNHSKLNVNLTNIESDLRISKDNKGLQYIERSEITQQLGKFHISFPSNFFLFAKDIRNIEHVTRNFQIINSYPKLGAIELLIESYQDYTSLKKKFGKMLILSDLFNDLSREKVNSKITSLVEEDISLNNELSEALHNIINIEPLWDQGYNGTGVVAAVIDNGIDFTNYLLNGKSNGSYDISTSTTTPCKSHGTSVAGLIAGSSSNQIIGSAYGAELFDISLGCSGSGVEGNLLDGFEFIIDNNDTIKIVNTSFDANLPPWDFITERLVNAGIVVVGSVGNGGPGLHTAKTGGPGNSIHGIGVGSTDFDNELSFYSSWGPTYNFISKPDVLAPGERVLSSILGNSTDEVIGTSFSSPVVAGGIAAVISGLKNNNIDWNVGLIKSAIMKSSNQIGTPNYIYGNGIVNFSSMYDLILNSTIGSNNIPELVHFADSSTPFPYLSSIPSGVIVDIPVTMISSHPQNVTIELSESLQDYIQILPANQNFSQQIILKFNSSNILTNTTINGTITASLGGSQSEIAFSVHVNHEVKGIVGIDTRHSYYNSLGYNGISGSNTGKMSQLMFSSGYNVIEIKDNLTNEILSDIDILWMADPINLVSLEENFEVNTINENPLYTSEINSILEYVDLGGSLLITTNGLLEERIPLGNSVYGLNSSGLNLLINNFGINMSSNALELDNFRNIMFPNNESSIAKDVNQISYNGNFLNVINDNAQIVMSDVEENIGAAVYYDSDGSGKVFVSSSNLWLNNIALSGGYPEARVSNIEFSKNVINWLSSNSYPIKLSESITQNFISGSYLIVENNMVVSLPNSVYLEKNSYHDYQQIEVLQNGSVFSFNYSIENDGIYSIVTNVDDQYISWKHVLDTTPPNIIPNVNNQNNTEFELDDNLEIEFFIQDDISEINQETLNITWFPTSDNVEYHFNQFNGRLRIFLNLSDFNSNNFRIEISCSDDFLNNVNSIYHYTISNSPIINTDQETTQRINPEGDNSFLITSFVVLGLISVFVLTYRRRYLG